EPRIGVTCKPTSRAVTTISWIPIRIIGLYLHLNRVLKSDFFECFIPHEYAVANCVAILHRNRILQPINDRLFWRRQRRRRILFLQVPTINVALRRGVTIVVAVVFDRVYEVAHASVCESRPKACVRSLTDAVTQMKEHTANVGKIARRPWQRGRWLARCKQWRQWRTFSCVMRDRFDFYVLREALDCAEVTVLWIEAIRNSVSRFQIVTKHRQVSKYESAEVYQNTFTFRMRQTLDLGDAEDRVAKGSRDCAAHRTVLSPEASVLYH